MTHPHQRGWKRGDPLEDLLTREWLVTNALGGYASGTIGGACTRRFHGLLVAALPAPLARTMMFNHLEETLSGPDGEFLLSADEQSDQVTYPEPELIEEFALECGLPVWRYAANGIRIEKRIVMPHLQNTTYVVYRLLQGPPGLTLHLRPALHFRPHEGLLTKETHHAWEVHERGEMLEIVDGGTDFPPLRIHLLGNARLVHDVKIVPHVIYRIEKSRGYDNEGPLWSPGVIRIELAEGEEAGFVATVESIDVQPAEEVFAAEARRRSSLLSTANVRPDDDVTAQLVLAADQFLIHPASRVAEDEASRTVIAGYHWFTDWGRDTMISLEGLTLVTGRHREAGRILRTFAAYIRDGLIPNMFPEGDSEGRYHTADATMWFFHAVWRYLKHTGDRETVRELVPRLVGIIDAHVQGTRFDIRVDPKDGLLSQGAEGYQLTWMDAKVDGWVVTPRRGKAVEINALFYNALRILAELLEDDPRADRMRALAERVRASFNERFWYEEGGHLYDVIDEHDPALRPNQIFAVSLDFPLLDPSRWAQVVGVVQRELLTPVGLRSLGRNHPDYKPRYDGDLRARDAAYHQGTVWSWLIGPFIDAWMKVHKDRDTALRFLDGFLPHLGDACVGTISEVFDAEEPYHPRGCAAQAWGVAEMLRVLRG